MVEASSSTSKRKGQNGSAEPSRKRQRRDREQDVAAPAAKLINSVAPIAHTKSTPKAKAPAKPTISLQSQTPTAGPAVKFDRPKDQKQEQKRARDGGKGKWNGKSQNVQPGPSKPAGDPLEQTDSKSEGPHPPALPPNPRVEALSGRKRKRRITHGKSAGPPAKVDQAVTVHSPKIEATPLNGIAEPVEPVPSDSTASAKTPSDPKRKRRRNKRGHHNDETAGQTQFAPAASDVTPPATVSQSPIKPLELALPVAQSLPREPSPPAAESQNVEQQSSPERIPLPITQKSVPSQTSSTVPASQHDPSPTIATPQPESPASRASPAAERIEVPISAEVPDSATLNGISSPPAGSAGSSDDAPSPASDAGSAVLSIHELAMAKPKRPNARTGYSVSAVTIEAVTPPPSDSGESDDQGSNRSRSASPASSNSSASDDESAASVVGEESGAQDAEVHDIPHSEARATTKKPEDTGNTDIAQSAIVNGQSRADEVTEKDTSGEATASEQVSATAHELPNGTAVPIAAAPEQPAPTAEDRPSPAAVSGEGPEPNGATEDSAINEAGAESASDAGSSRSGSPAPSDNGSEHSDSGVSEASSGPLIRPAARAFDPALVPTYNFPLLSQLDISKIKTMNAPAAAPAQRTATRQDESSSSDSESSSDEDVPAGMKARYATGKKVKAGVKTNGVMKGW